MQTNFFDTLNYSPGKKAAGTATPPPPPPATTKEAKTPKAKKVGIQSKALTVSLTVCQWSGRKLDKKITQEVNQQHNADDDAGRYNKLLIAKKYLDPIAKAANAARTFHMANTLPWADKGDRLLASANFLSYTKEMARFKSDFEREVTAFIAVYEDAKNDAKIRLNGMYNGNDYPNPVELKKCFEFDTCFLPLPEEDFRLELSQTEINALTKQVENTFKERISAAVSDTWDRIKEQLTHMKTKLREVKDDGSAGVFRDSLFNNLRDLIDLLPRLNVTDDPNITKICEAMQVLLVDPEKVRTNSNLRAEKANEVDKIMNDFGQFFA